MTEKDYTEYMEMPADKFSPFHWLNKANDFVNEKLEEADRGIGQEVWGSVKTTLADWGIVVWDWFVAVLPDIVGYSALGCGALMALSALAGRGIVKPAGLFGAIGIVSVSILEVV